MKQYFLLAAVLLTIFASCKKETTDDTPATFTFPDTVKVEGIAQNPEGIEYNKNDSTFFLSSINAGAIIKVNLDGTYTAFTSGEAYPMSTAGLQIDYANNRLLAAAFNGTELMDDDPATKGVSNLRIYNLETGVLEKDINLSSLAPQESFAYFANDIAVDNNGNAYISDWYARVIYKVDLAGNATLFWKNETDIAGGPNGLDIHPDGYLLVSLLNVDQATGLYADYGLVKIPVNAPETATVVNFSNTGFTGFDGMVLTTEGKIIGISNNGTAPGGNMLLELEGANNWETAKVVNSKAVTASTTVAITPEKLNFVINQDFANGAKENWIIEQIKF